MRQPSRPPSPIAIAAIALAALIGGFFVFWSHRTTAEVKQWTPADHDQPAGQPTTPPPRPRPQPQAQPQPQQDTTNLVELAWTRNCTPCHGDRGRGDGPQGAMLRAPDLTRPDWQSRVTDDDIRQTIRQGRNNMPRFDLPPAVLDGLVKRIRDNKGGRAN